MSKKKYYLQPSGKGEWEIISRGARRPMKKFKTKGAAMKYMKKNIAKKYKNTKNKASVRIKGRNGRIKDERSYGRGSESDRRG